MTRDTGVALVLLALAGLYWLGADQIRVSRLEGIVGAQAVPKSLALALAVLSALLIVQELWRARRIAAPAVAEDGGTSRSHAHLHAAGMLLIGVGYLVLVDTIGYLPAIALLVLATGRYMGEPWSGRLITIGLGGAVLYHLIFVRLLGIPLPPGIWPELWRSLG